MSFTLFQKLELKISVFQDLIPVQLVLVVSNYYQTLIDRDPPGTPNYYLDHQQPVRHRF